MTNKNEIICISSAGKTLADPLYPNFNICPYFLIIKPDQDEIKVIPNPGAKDNPREIGLPGAQTILKENISVLLTGHLGPKAFGALESYGVRFVIGLKDMTGQRALNDYLLGKSEVIG